MSEYRLIPLSGQNGAGKFAKVSVEDYESLKNYKWYLRLGYAVRNFRKDERAETGLTETTMHRQVMRAPKEKVVDHKNGDRLDNQRFNLRYCTHNQNTKGQHVVRGVSQYKGVFKNRDKWRAAIRVNGKTMNLGTYTKESSAASAYDEAAEEFFGEFAVLNFPKR